MDQPELPSSEKRLYVTEWSSRALHGTAMMFNRLRGEQDLSERQEWLYDRIIDELEWRCVETLRVRPWDACTCFLCLSPFPTEQLDEERDEEYEHPVESRPDGSPISRRRPKHAPESYTG